jgi:hypothetical protein
MFKEFLDYLGGNDDAEEIPEGGYLDHLLEEVEPRVESELDACPGHDPLLVVAAEVMRTLSEGRWEDDELRCPVADADSPPQQDPPPPPEPADDSDEAAEGGAFEEDPAEETGDFQIESTAEIPPETTQRVRSVDVSEESADTPDYRLDADPILRAARVFYGVLVQNDRLPVSLQMRPRDIAAARDLLLAYFSEDGELKQKARNLMGVVEKKFNEGYFSQAKILIRLFDADEGTLNENDRNLFYDDMLMRFGQKSATEGMRLDRTVLDAKFDALVDEEIELPEFFDAMAEEYAVHMNVLAEPATSVDHWDELFEMSNRVTTQTGSVDVLPERRWRPMSTFGRDPGELLDAYVVPDSMGPYVQRHLKTAFFILRAVGDTGMEPYLDTVFEWSERAFGVDGPALMPGIYQEATDSKRTIDDIFNDVYEASYSETAEEAVQAWDRDDVEEAAGTVASRIPDLELHRLSGGHFDFGGLLLDELFGLEFHDATFAVKIHQLT